MPVGCQEAKRLGESVQFGGLFAGALEDISGLNEELLFSFSKLLRLTLPQQLSLGLGLVQSVSSEATQQEGAKFLKSKLNELNANNGGSVPPSIVQQLLFHLQTHDGFAKQKASFVKIYRQLIPEVHAPVSLVPALYNELPEVDSKRTYDPEVLPFSPSFVAVHLRLPLSAYRRSTQWPSGPTCASPAACIATRGSHREPFGPFFHETLGGAVSAGGHLSLVRLDRIEDARLRYDRRHRLHVHRVGTAAARGL
jgi:hypothetical protein